MGNNGTVNNEVKIKFNELTQLKSFLYNSVRENYMTIENKDLWAKAHGNPSIEPGKRMRFRMGDTGLKTS